MTFHNWRDIKLDARSVRRFQSQFFLLQLEKKTLFTNNVSHICINNTVILNNLVSLWKVCYWEENISRQIEIPSLLKVQDFQKKIGIIYRPKQICHFTILNLSFEFLCVFYNNVAFCQVRFYLVRVSKWQVLRRTKCDFKNSSVRWWFGIFFSPDQIFWKKVTFNVFLVNTP